MYQTDYKCYAISGEDSEEFLQGQVTCDITTLQERPSMAAFCSHDGKILGLFYLCKLDHSFLLLTDDDQPEKFINRLKMFVLRAKVSIEQKDYFTYGSNKEQPQEQKNEALSTIAINDNLSLVIYESEQNSTFSTNDWNYVETLNGIPQINERNRGEIIAPFLNLDWLKAISYQKGCYVGQEIIARLHFRSKPPKRSFVYTSDQLLENLTLNQPLNYRDENDKPCKITIRRLAHNKESEQAKTVILAELAYRDKIKQELHSAENQPAITWKHLNTFYLAK